MSPQVSPLDFFANLVWIDGRPLLDTMEEFRRELFKEVFRFDDDGRPHYSRVLVGRAKKNFKTTDLVLACLHKFFAWESPAGSDALICAADEGQAGDDLSLVKKLIAINPILAREVKVYAKEIARLDGKGVLKILPGQDVAGSHGKTFLFLGHDEIHTRQNYDLFEALSPDPTRPDTLTWITSYSSILHRAGVPLYDMLESAKAGADPRLLFQWYSGSFTTAPGLDDLTPEERANPSMASWDQPDYLAEQRARLPTSRFRRLHLNEPGSPDGAAFSADAVMACVVKGRRRLSYQPHLRFNVAVDLSHGSVDDAGLAVSHRDPETGRAVLDFVARQDGRPPFNARHAVAKFADIALHQYGSNIVTGDTVGGMTYRLDFQERGVHYRVLPKIAREERGQPSASGYYEQLEARINAGEVELLDDPLLIEQILGLVWKGGKITHEAGAHDDVANAAAIALVLANPLRNRRLIVTPEVLTLASLPPGARAAGVRLLADLPADATSREKMDYTSGREATFGTPAATPARTHALYIPAAVLQRAAHRPGAGQSHAGLHDLHVGCSFDIYGRYGR